MDIQNGLTRAEKQVIIIETIKEYANQANNNWANLAQVGVALRQKGLKYGKLHKMLLSFSHILMFQQDYEYHTPVTYVKLK